MDQERIGKFIKTLRKKNNLSQQQLASKLGVSSQAVSKWENGKNIPDIAILKEISKQFNINIDDIINGKVNKSKQNRNNWIIIIILIIIIVLLSTYLIVKSSNFEFKNVSSKCDNFTIYGNLAYNSKKSTIYITKIKYCNEQDIEKYNEIECTLYEHSGKTETAISTYNYKKDKVITLGEFLDNVTFSIDNYERICREYKEDSLSLKIKATKNGKTTIYEVPLSLDDTCKK